MARRRKKKNRAIIIVLTAIIMIMLTAAVIIGLSLSSNKRYPNLEGEYEGELEISELVYANAALWLSDIQGYEVLASDISDSIGPVNVNVTMSVEKAKRGTGTYNIALNEDSYLSCVHKVNAGLSQILEEAVTLRLSDLGYDFDEENTTYDGIVKTALGSDLLEYLNGCELNIVPSLDELRAICNEKGEYSVEDGNMSLVVKPESGNEYTEEHIFIYDGEKLAFTDDDYVFTKKKEGNSEETN